MIDMVCPPGLVQVVSLLDHLVRPQQYQRRNREAERPRGLRLITNSNFVGCSRVARDPRFVMHC